MQFPEGERESKQQSATSNLRKGWLSLGRSYLSKKVEARKLNIKQIRFSILTKFDCVFDQVGWKGPLTGLPGWVQTDQLKNIAATWNK